MTSAAATYDASQPMPRQPPLGRVVEVLLILLIFFIAAGDPPPHVNEAHYIGRLKHFWDPTWCAGDLFLESTDTQLVVIWLLGWLTQWSSLSATAWIGRFLAWTLLAWAWQRLSWRLVPTRLAAVLSAALFVTLSSLGHLAGEWVIGGFEAKCFAYGFVLLALRELVDGRWNRLWLLLGAATSFHPLVGGWSAIVCGGIWLGDGRREMPLRSMVWGLAGGLLLTLPGLLPALSLTWNEPADRVAEATRIYVFERLPHHLALLSLPREEFTRRLTGHVVLLAALAGLAVGPHRQPVIRTMQFAGGAVLLACTGFVIELTLSHDPLAAARLLRYYWYRLTDFAAPMAVALSVTAWIAAGLAYKRSWAPWALVAVMLLVSGHLLSIAWGRVNNPVPPADARLADYSAWLDVCAWIKTNTPADAMFLTPRLNHSFKWRTGRAEVVTRKDVPQDAAGILEWDRRIKDIYYFETPAGLAGPIDSLCVLSAERLQELAAKYGADFVLADRTQLLSLPRAYWNTEYVVYRTEHGTAGAAR
jgi:hypothetical protein